VVNAGGVRDSLPAGRLTYKDLLKVHPFGNTIATVELSGAELLDYLAVVVSMTPGSGAFPQFAGIKLLIEGGKVSRAEIQGVAVDPARSYRMAINNFVASGGDGYPRLTQHRSFVDSGFVDAEVLRAFVGANSPIKVADYAPQQVVQRR
jgi:5'-nucleotidase/UDP-sugar diphosphatase